MTVVLAIACLALVALLAYRERVAARDRDADRLFREALERRSIEERRDHAVEREKLYQRIQAPEIAVHEAQLEARRERPYVRREPIGADNDAAFMRQREERLKAGLAAADLSGSLGSPEAGHEEPERG